jgi:hypothetical protein
MGETLSVIALAPMALYIALDLLCTDRQIHLLTVCILTVLLFSVLRKGSPPPINHTALREEALVRENSALCITIKNLSDEHTLLCEMRATLARQRKESMRAMNAILMHQRQSPSDVDRQSENSSIRQTPSDDGKRAGNRHSSIMGGSCRDIRPETQTLMRRSSKSESDLESLLAREQRV